MNLRFSYQAPRTPWPSGGAEYCLAGKKAKKLAMENGVEKIIVPQPFLSFMHATYSGYKILTPPYIAVWTASIQWD